jgi:4-hydroxybenzoate polyprenyltransferase
MSLSQIKQYAYLIRLHKPIGIFLLLWPTLWGLLLATHGQPHLQTVVIFVSGVFLMRSAGCIMNDIADRHVDGHVERTRNRPIASGKIGVIPALIFAGLLALTAFISVLFCNFLTIKLAFVGAALANIYPFLKRVTPLPQAGLGLAFAWGVPMAFAAENNLLTSQMWWVFAAAALWPIIYDTMYAMADRQDDLQIGVKSTAILFGTNDVPILLFLQGVFVFLLAMIGMIFRLHSIYYFSICIVILLFIYEFILIKDRDPHQCFKAFLHNNWVGMTIFAGIFLDYYL